MYKKSELQDSKTKTTHFDLEIIRWMGPVIWSFVQENMKNIKSLDIFKQEIKKLTCDECSCKMCKEYSQGIGYLK